MCCDSSSLCAGDNVLSAVVSLCAGDNVLCVVIIVFFVCWRQCPLCCV